MILLCDENISPRVPETLRQDGYDARSFHMMGWLSRRDLQWLPGAGQMEGSLILTRDRSMLDNSNEKQAIIDNNLGVVFLTAGQQSVEDLIRLVVNSWDQLEHLHDTTPRPFVRFLTTTGNLRERLHGRGL